ncbi:MAG: DNA gyrase/topoisomerase IV subunit A [Fibromonadaceae bacterium]|jgi:topoisomerase-4 subunit A|nr:DNA gyrase/topoisomerase IV subunit A [Fibromonadaceae bacterium]
MSDHLEKLYENWFLDYASYVILDRSVPYYEDGLKPVQRRILHTLYEMNKSDERMHKVANIVGRTMQYHPHGDASIGDALVNMGQKKLLIETQGNWGNPITGDPAAAPRYIEGRLSQFALDVLFNPETTKWVSNYDGRSKEPVCLPVKFPLVLAQGAEGIAVALSTSVLPHNFCELCEASIAALKGKKFQLFPDFSTGGIVDVSNYNDGLRGGRVKVRARIEKLDAKTLVIREIPFGATTEKLVESITKANEKGKIKIKKVDDHTSKSAELVVHLQPGSDPQIVIDALYAFTDCEKSLAPNNCVIVDDKPHFLGTTEILKRSAEHTKKLLEWELKNKMQHLQERWHMISLEKIFIEKEVYETIKKARNKEEMISLVDGGLKPFVKKLRRAVTREDILKLVEIPMRRISLFDQKKANELLKEIDEQIKETALNLENLIDYAVDWFKGLLKKYGAGRERKSVIAEFDKVSAVHVALSNQKLYVHRKEGFIGTGLKKEEYLFDVSEYDDLIAFCQDGTFKVFKVSEKAFIGKDILLVEKFNKDDTRRIYNVIYQEGKDGPAYVKRFNVGGITREKAYTMGKGAAGSKLLWITSNPNGEAESVTVFLKPKPRIKLEIPVDFSENLVKGRDAIGNQITKYAVKNVKMLKKGASTLGDMELFFDQLSGMVNIANKGDSLGEFGKFDKLLVVKENGTAKIYEANETVLVGQQITYIARYESSKIYTLLYFDGAGSQYCVKRFNLENAPQTAEFSLLTDSPASSMLLFYDEDLPIAQIDGKEHNLAELAEVRGFRAIGNKLDFKRIKKAVKVPALVMG